MWNKMINTYILETTNNGDKNGLLSGSPKVHMGRPTWAWPFWPPNSTHDEETHS